MKNILITGAAGFIGSNLVRKFIETDCIVLGIDNLCRGTTENILDVLGDRCFQFENVDINSFDKFHLVVSEFNRRHPIDEVWHMAANSDIPAGIANMDIDFLDTFMTTFNTIKVMRLLNITTIAFASSSAIYGDMGDRKLVEGIGPLFPISNYGAMKLGSEALLSASAESFLNKVFIFRFPNVIGTPATHGVILDFIRKLSQTPENLNVLGNGTQRKTYLHVSELIDAMFFIRNNAFDKINFFNIGADDDGATVKFIAENVVKLVSQTASISYGDEERGWVGDVPTFNYSIEKLKLLGWSPKLNSKQSVIKAIQEIVLKEFQA